MDDGIRVTEELQAVLEEGRLNRNKFLKLRKGEGLLQQLPGRILREVRVDELCWSWHEVVLVQFVANVVRRQLTTSIKKWDNRYKKSFHKTWTSTCSIIIIIIIFH